MAFRGLDLDRSKVKEIYLDFLHITLRTGTITFLSFFFFNFYQINICEINILSSQTLMFTHTGNKDSIQVFNASLCMWI